MIIVAVNEFAKEAPAKLVGWFDRVWSYGFAYGDKTMRTLSKGLVLCVAGNSRADLEKYGLLQSMKKVMLGDRLFNRVQAAEFIVLDGMTKAYPLRTENWERHLATVYEKGRSLFA